MNIKLVSIEEIENVMEIIEDARALLKETSHQWQNNYPNRSTLINDISNQYLFGAYINNELAGIMALVPGFNVDYDIIEGEWITPPSDKDLVIHRIAVKSRYRGNKVGDTLMKYAEVYAKEKGYLSLKADTHRLNIPMTKLCINNGYHMSGIIYIKRIEPDPSRLLFEKNVE